VRSAKLYLADILEAMVAIERFVEGMDFETFRKDDKTSSAVIRKFEVIGEAAKQVPESIRQKHPAVPWKRMAGMRDRLIHFYFGVKHELVWETIRQELPRLKPLIRMILEEIEGDTN
jgi:uncharacterized protein with HEPN domain